MKIDLIVFDLDGTLVSSHENIYRATVKALEMVNVEAVMPESEFYKMIGLHFEDIFNKFGFAVPDFEKFLNGYKSIYFDYINTSTLYSGVQETLQALFEADTKVALLTTKGQDQADRILKHFGIHEKFNYVMGRRAGLAHKPSADPLLKICADLSAEPSRTLMTGDSEMDVMCGKNAGSKTCAVSYGYRTRDELQIQAPDFIIDNIVEIIRISKNA